MDQLPKAVTERVAHQGNPVTACSPSIRLIAAPTGPSWRELGVCVAISVATGAGADHCSDRSHVEGDEESFDSSLSQSGKLLKKRCEQRKSRSDTKQHLRTAARHRRATDATWACCRSTFAGPHRKPSSQPVHEISQLQLYASESFATRLTAFAV